ncbi:MAG: DUF2341 domain-containing protein, partial [Verrucomicrobiaceae bacterium]
MTKALIFCAFILVASCETARSQYPGWQRSGSLHIITTPEGANLPASAAEENFPLLVRLNKANFDFNQTKPGGVDIRFSAGGKPLAYQIDEWDAAAGTASIWVRIPVIKGNSRQEIKMHWGKADAVSESNGNAVFNESGGFYSVMHLSDPADTLKDEVGSVTPVNAGTTPGVGMIGRSRHFVLGQGVNCGDKITTFPAGASPHSTSAWIRPEKGRNGQRVIVWGKGEPKSNVQIMLSNAVPPVFWADCYNGGASVSSKSGIKNSEWYHVVHTYKEGEAKIYVNGVLDGVRTDGPAMTISSPGFMILGGQAPGAWQYVGDMDEVRIAKATRSADWVRLEYENQKPLQTLVGSLVQSGNSFAVSQAAVTIEEGKSVTIAAQAGGAQKVLWILKKQGAESVVAVDQYSYTLEAGRVMGDTSLVLQFKAVYAGEVKVKDVAVTVKETIPEPVFTLKAPARWNGRDPVEVVPEISNLAAMKAKGAGELHYTWTVTGGAVIKEIAPDRLILKHSQYTGPITVKAAIDNGGVAIAAAASIEVKEPGGDPWVQRVPAKDIL